MDELEGLTLLLFVLLLAMTLLAHFDPYGHEKAGRSAMSTRSAHIRETQEYQMIGGVSPELEVVAAEHQGWGPAPGPGENSDLYRSEAPESMEGELTDASDFSFRDRRANMQNRSWAAGPGLYTLPAGYDAVPIEPPMAAVSVQPVGEAPADPNEAAYPQKQGYRAL